MKARTVWWVLVILLFPSLFLFLRTGNNFKPSKLAHGQKTDSLNGVYVFHNGPYGNVSGRNTTSDGYNLGLKYQCVEFVKRYYYEHYRHKMPDSYGHAKDFFDRGIPDGHLNKRRNLIQYSNPGASKPSPGDLLIFDASAFNKYGHVAIVSAVTPGKIEIIQQNPGVNGKTRATYGMAREKGKWRIEHNRILGWLRKEGGR